MRAITVYTENLAELLRRKKVRRDVLFQYADQEQIAVKPNDEKLTLIQRILSQLGSRPLPVGYNVVYIYCTLAIYVINWLLYFSTCVIVHSVITELYTMETETL